SPKLCCHPFARFPFARLLTSALRFHRQPPERPPSGARPAVETRRKEGVSSHVPGLIHPTSVPYARQCPAEASFNMLRLRFSENGLHGSSGESCIPTSRLKLLTWIRFCRGISDVDRPFNERERGRGPMCGRS